MIPDKASKAAARLARKAAKLCADSNPDAASMLCSVALTLEGKQWWQE